MGQGLQCFKNGVLTFDSNTANVLFLIDEVAIPASGVGSGQTFSYPAWAGKKISAFLTITSGDFDPQGGLAVPSCRVQYSGGTPQVTVFFDNASASIPKADAYLSVFYTGAPQ